MKNVQKKKKNLMCNLLFAKSYYLNTVTSNNISFETAINKAQIYNKYKRKKLI